MSLISDYLSKRMTTITKEQLNGAKGFRSYAFNYYTNLKSIEIPYSVKIFGVGVFVNCTSLETINTDSMDPYAIIPTTGIFNLNDTLKWWLDRPVGQFVTIANGQILVGNKISTPSSGFVIPSTVKNIAFSGCGKYSDTTDSNFTSVVIPDTVEMLQNRIFDGQTTLTKITVGAGVRKMTGRIVPGASVKNMIFRQPAGMTVELPTPGEATGIAYNKDAYSMNIYTDNEDIRNYGWATDNVTATFYPLSSAP